jgi:histidine ammonia-lyase
MAADFLAIAVAELGNISERRIQMLLDENHSRNLPGNLIADPGLNSGFMLTQYTAASLVSENKIYCHPSSVDSIPTSANVEDHVAMATTAARKAQVVVNTSRMVLAIELMVAAQAMEWRMMSEDGKVVAKTIGRNPKKETKEADKTRLGEMRAALGLQSHFAKNFGQQPAAKTCEGPSAKVVVASMGAGTGKVYQAIREKVPALVEDIYLGPLVQDAIGVVASGSISLIIRSMESAIP